MHINQLLIYNSYIQLLLQFGGEAGQGKAWSHLKPDTKSQAHSNHVHGHSTTIKSSK